MTTDDDPTSAAVADDPLNALFRELAHGRTDALDGVWRACADQLYGLALWRTRSVADAEDAVQEVFVRLARHGSKLTYVRDPRSYLLRMARNAAADIAGRRRHEPLTDEIPPHRKHVATHGDTDTLAIALLSDPCLDPSTEGDCT